jgi:hypothetical protein
VGIFRRPSCVRFDLPTVEAKLEHLFTHSTSHRLTGGIADGVERRYLRWNIKTVKSQHYQTRVADRSMITSVGSRKMSETCIMSESGTDVAWKSSPSVVPTYVLAFVSFVLLARSVRLRQAVRTRLLQTKVILRNGSKLRRELAVLT